MIQENLTVHWVRHGPTHANAMVGWTDVAADLGDQAALKRLSAFLPDEAPVISSDLTRATVTADAIQGDRKRLAHAAGLREMHFGDWEMKTHAEVEAEHPDLIRAFWEAPGDVRPPGGESWNDLTARVARALETLPHVGPDLIAVAHFGVILGQLQLAKGWTATRAFSQPIDNLSVTRITYGARRQADVINHNP